VRELPKDSKRRLFSMGLVTSLLNPKVAVLYLSLLPQFIDPAAGSVFTQSVVFGFVHIAVSLTFNAIFALTAGSVALFFVRRPSFARVQRWLMGTVLAGLAVRMAFEAQR